MSNRELRLASVAHLRRWLAQANPDIIKEGRADQFRYFMRNSRLKCDMCHSWMVTTLPTPRTPLLRADSPHAGICVECARVSK